jgi:broad specificity phosphatase PhoE
MKGERGVFYHPEGLLYKEHLPPGTARLFVVRHGESTANAANAYHIKDPVLTEKGKLQAAALGRQLREGDINFDQVYTSGKPRAVQTAKLILAGMGTYREPQVRKNLRERRKGISVAKYGERITDIDLQLREHLAAFPEQEQWTHIPTLESIDPKSYESHATAAQRFEKELIDIADTHPDEDILVVAHGVVMLEFLALQRIKNGWWERHPDRSIFSGLHVSNTGNFALNSRDDHGRTALDFISVDL